MFSVFGQLGGRKNRNTTLCDVTLARTRANPAISCSGLVPLCCRNRHRAQIRCIRHQDATIHHVHPKYAQNLDKTHKWDTKVDVIALIVQVRISLLLI